MRLTREASAILGRASIGMLALRAGRAAHGAPLVNPAVFSFAQGSLWMTTSRYAAKTIIARRDPRAAFLVDGESTALHLRGSLEVFDPLSVSGQVRAMLDGPGYFLGMAAYALKNAPYFAGYVLDLARLPRAWLPYNRVVLRLRLSHADIIEAAPFPAAQAARVPAVPADVSRRLAGVSRGYACWIEGAMPVIRPAYWDVERGEISVAPISGRPRSGSAGAVVIEAHHRFRPSLMVGACVRGTFGGEEDEEAIAERYGLPPADVPRTVTMRAERVTAWRGFSVTTAVPRSARELRVLGERG
ncbi:MAG TPA: hypothetical protein VLU92_01485 [Candidatus Dormibacteraeota bacterium]|nr:hypothetical protein [Candidatus Dormibacteraeota bacterium]